MKPPNSTSQKAGPEARAPTKLWQINSDFRTLSQISSHHLNWTGEKKLQPRGTAAPQQVNIANQTDFVAFNPRGFRRIPTYSRLNLAKNKHFFKSHVQEPERR
jgi:hypothetical protein